MRPFSVLALLAILSLSGFAQSRVARDTIRMDNDKEIARERAIIPYIEKAKKQVQVDDVFVAVDSIKNGKVYGHINSPVFIRGYKQGHLLSFAESEIINWVILRPDGSEEGNYVGKFLEHYTPK